MVLKIVSCEEIAGGDVMAKDNNKLKMENDRLRKNLYEKSHEMDKQRITIKLLENKEKEFEKKLLSYTTK